MGGLELRLAGSRVSSTPSWQLDDEAISSATGLLFPSIHHAGGINLVVFIANLTAGDRLAVHDPDDMLPKDQRSWEPRSS